ncbi:hypothetical protein HK098_004962 [Nowakowskiella sp. JEL0407]|nr:hypothetical protein HK098_004962 [Nowakowskiella sp. JEL0407]
MYRGREAPMEFERTLPLAPNFSLQNNTNNSFFAPPSFTRSKSVEEENKSSNDSIDNNSTMNNTQMTDQSLSESLSFNFTFTPGSDKPQHSKAWLNSAHSPYGRLKHTKATAALSNLTEKLTDTKLEDDRQQKKRKKAGEDQLLQWPIESTFVHHHHHHLHAPKFSNTFENHNDEPYIMPSSPPDKIQSKINHADLASLIWSYVRLFFSVSVLVLLFSILVAFLLAVQADLKAKANEFARETSRAIAECSKQYILNSCSPIENRAPALETMCNDWEICMMRDPKEVARLQIGAEALAEVINKLVEPLSLKSMVFGAVLFFGSLFISIYTLASYRSQQNIPSINLTVPPPKEYAELNYERKLIKNSSS